MSNAIETIVIYEAKTYVARGLINRVKRQKDKVAENASNKRKWEGDHDGSSSQQQKKEYKIVAQRVANVIDTIAIYEAKTRMAHDLMNRVRRQKDKVAENASNKKKWEGNHGKSSGQKQNKWHKVIRAHTVEPSNKKGYAINLPLCNKCKFHHTGPCAEKCGNCKRVGHQTRDCRTPILKEKQRPSMAKQKAKITYYECERLGHYKNGCPERKNQNQVKKSYDHFTSGHNRIILVRRGTLAESSQSSESSIGVRYNTCGSIVHSTTNHNDFDHFKRGEKIQATKVKEPQRSGFTRETNQVYYLCKDTPGSPSGTWTVDAQGAWLVSRVIYTNM
nr:reverse transcriptase domain-containing protein [Tanacetum cinerariifolium]